MRHRQVRNPTAVHTARRRRRHWPLPALASHRHAAQLLPARHLLRRPRLPPFTDPRFGLAGGRHERQQARRRWRHWPLPALASHRHAAQLLPARHLLRRPRLPPFTDPRFGLAGGRHERQQARRQWRHWPLPALASHRHAAQLLSARHLLRRPRLSPCLDARIGPRHWRHQREPKQARRPVPALAPRGHAAQLLPGGNRVHGASLPPSAWFRARRDRQWRHHRHQDLPGRNACDPLRPMRDECDADIQARAQADNANSDR